MTFLKVLGIDLSLTAPGVALAAAGELTTETVKIPTAMRGIERLEHIRAVLGDWAWGKGVALAVVEGPSYGSQAGQSGHHERAGLWWLVRVDLHRHEIPVAVVPPSTLKRYATGKGTAPKDAMTLAADRRFPAAGVSDNNSADAAFLAAMGARWLGEPVDDMPQAHLAAMAGAAWPDAVAGVAA
jgi:crossover junction endodeoxyribonuclease RuvC